MPSIECHVCHTTDDLQNLTQLWVANAGVEATAYAHPHCIKQHNEKAKKGMRAFQASTLANLVLDYDVDPEDTWKVECTLREKYPKLRRDSSLDYPSLTKQFIAEVADAACSLRNERRLKGVFDHINNTVEAWPAKASDEFVADVADNLVVEMHHLAYEHGDPEWRDDGAIETRAAHYAALLLIQQVARRKYEAEFNASYEQWKALSEESEDA